MELLFFVLNFFWRILIGWILNQKSYLKRAICYLIVLDKQNYIVIWIPWLKSFKNWFSLAIVYVLYVYQTLLFCQMKLSQLVVYQFLYHFNFSFKYNQSLQLQSVIQQRNKVLSKKDFSLDLKIINIRELLGIQLISLKMFQKCMVEFSL